MTIIGGILVLFVYITRLASKEIFSPSNKIHREVGRAKDLSAHLYRQRMFLGLSLPGHDVVTEVTTLEDEDTSVSINRKHFTELVKVMS
jgi:hypothetical protein